MSDFCPFQLLVDYSYDPNYRFNAKLLVEYGFVVRNNPYDSATVKVRMQIYTL